MARSEDLLKGLDTDQLAAVTASGPTVCVLAGAGSGKTRVLTRRVAWRIAEETAEASHTLVLTFTRKAADELRDRLRGLGVDDSITTGTFHAVAYAQLRRYWLDQNRAVPNVISQPTRVVEHVLQTLRLGRSINQRTVASEISWAKSKLLLPDDYEQGVRQYQRRPPLATHQLTRIYAAYESEKRKRRTVDYDDLLLLMTQALNEDRKFCASQQWLIRHIYVDEFQDLNGAQFNLLRAWLGNKDDLFLVGDPNQAIYGWNGADSSYLVNVDRYFAGVEMHNLRTNYRSTDQVLAAANAVLPSANDVSGDEPEQGSPPRVIACANEDEEALSITRIVREARGRGHNWNDVAVLVRTNVQRNTIEAAMARFGVPTRSSGGSAWLYKPEVAAVLGQLREVPRHQLARSVADLEEAMDGAAETDRSYLKELVALARQCLETDPLIVNADFLSWIEVSSRNDGPTANTNAVTVTTFHRAKGLEWPVVVIGGVEEGFVPHGNPSGAQLEEERRLFYVAITRAKEEMICTWAQQRVNSRGTAVARNPSPWLEVISRAALREDIPTRQVVRDEIRKGREALVLDLTNEADERRQAIQSWRRARAKLIGMQDQLVLSDAIIEAIVIARPTNLAELAEVEGFGQVRAASVGEELLRMIGANEPSLDESPGFPTKVES